MDLPPHEIHVWCARPEALCDDDARQAAEKLLAPDEVRRMLRYRFEKDRLRFLAARVLLRNVLSTYDPRPPAAWEFVVGSHGRPELVSDDRSELRFNVSKTQDLVVCAVARNVVIGVDVENLTRPAPLDVANQFFAAAEAAALRALPEVDRPRRFYEYWTLKESYIKARGLGLLIPLDQFAFRLSPNQPPKIEFDPQLGDDERPWQFVHLKPTDQHLIAVCMRRDEPIENDVSLHWHKPAPSD